MTLSDQPILPPLVLTARQLAKLYGVDQPPPAWAPVPNADAEALALQARIVGEGPSRRRRQALALTLAGAATALGLQLLAHVAADVIAGPPLSVPVAAVLGWALHQAHAADEGEQLALFAPPPAKPAPPAVDPEPTAKGRKRKAAGK